MRLDVSRSRVLTALVQTMATLPREVAKNIRQQSKAVIVPEWKKQLAERAPARIFFTRLVNPATAYVSDRGVKLIAGANGKFPRETEFGAYRETYVDYTTRKGSVHRRTKRQFWHFQKTGRVVIPAISEMIPRAGALFAQTAYRAVAEKIERAS